MSSLRSAVVLFERQDQAEAVATSLRDCEHRHDGVRTTGVDILEVVADA